MNYKFCLFSVVGALGSFAIIGFAISKHKTSSGLFNKKFLIESSRVRVPFIINNF